MEHGSQLLPGSICIAAVSRETPGPNGTKIQCGDVLTVQEHNTKANECMVLTVDGSTTMIPVLDLLYRQPVPLVPMLWFHGFIDRAEAQSRLDPDCIGQFLVRMSHNSPGVYAIAVCTDVGYKHFLVAINKVTHRVSLDGDEFFTDLPELIKFHLAEAPHRDRPEIPPLVEPVPVQGQVRYYVDQKLLEKVWGLPNDVEIVKSLGEGEFGEVHSGTYRGLQVAVKSIPDELEDQSAVWNFLQEAAVMTHLRHKNLVQLVGVVFCDSTPKGIVIELMAKGSLIKYLVSRGRSVVSHAELLGYARDVCDGMVYMSSMGFMHRDLAARNILLSSSGVAKICDFGLARKMDVYSPKEGGKFPIKWTAPEALKESKFSEKSDVWSFGIFLWELYSFGRTPYPSILVEKVLDQLEAGYTMDPPDNCPEEVYDIMCSCWNMDPDSRPCFVDLSKLLSKSFGESRTPCSSPLPNRRALAKVKAEIDSVVLAPKASEVYRSAPLTSYADMFLANLLFIGAESSGKTSLVRSFQGERFRQKEPSTVSLELPASYHELVSHRNWTLSMSGGLAYEHQLVRCIAKELLGDLQTSLNPSSDSAPPPLPPMRQRPISVYESSDAHPPPLPSRPPLQSRMSVNLEDLIVSNDSAYTPTGSPPTSKRSSKKKLNFSKLFSSKKAWRRKRSGSMDFEEVLTEHTRSFSLPYPIADSVQIATNSTPSTPTISSSAPISFISAIPDRLSDMIKERLTDSIAGSLPNEFFAKLIDCTSHTPTSLLSSLLITEATLVIAVVDLSRVQPVAANSTSESALNAEQLTEIDQLVNGVNTACHKWLSNPPYNMVKQNGVQRRSSPRIVLVGTHTDKVTGMAAMTSYDAAKKAIKSSPCGKFLSSAAFMVDSLSTIERFGNDDLKKFVIDCIKKGCKQSVPLRWLRCVRRFQNMPHNGQFFITRKETEKIVRELCQGCSEEEIPQIIAFLHKNLIIYDLSQLHPQLKGRVVSDLSWLVWQLSSLFSLRHDTTFSQLPNELLSDLEALHSQGVLSEKLMDYLWPFSHQTKQELLMVAQQLDLIFLQGADSLPLDFNWSLPTSPIKKKQSTTSVPPLPVITSVIVPSLVQRPHPPHHLCEDGVPLAEPIHLRFTGCAASSVFPRLVVRCLQNYSHNWVLCQSCAFFFLSQSIVLKVEDYNRTIRIALHSVHASGNSTPLSSSSSPPPSSVLSLISDSASEVAMTAFMFLKATATDLIAFWMPHATFDLAVRCCCSKASDGGHFVVLPSTDAMWNEETVCECEQTVHLPQLVAPWFGEEAPKHTQKTVALLEKKDEEEERAEEEEKEEKQEIENEENEEEQEEEQKKEKEELSVSLDDTLAERKDELEENQAIDYEATGDIQMVDQALQESWAMLTSAIGTQHNDFSASSSTQLPFSGSDRSTAELLQEWCDLSFQDDPLMEIISSFERTATSSSAS